MMMMALSIEGVSPHHHCDISFFTKISSLRSQPRIYAWIDERMSFGNPPLCRINQGKLRTHGQSISVSTRSTKSTQLLPLKPLSHHACMRSYYHLFDLRPYGCMLLLPAACIYRLVRRTVQHPSLSSRQQQVRGAARFLDRQPLSLPIEVPPWRCSNTTAAAEAVAMAMVTGSISWPRSRLCR
jgi:hypothetical protein